MTEPTMRTVKPITRQPTLAGVAPPCDLDPYAGLAEHEVDAICSARVVLAVRHGRCAVAKEIFYSWWRRWSERR